MFGGMLYHWPVNAHALQKCTLRHDRTEGCGVWGVGCGGCGGGRVRGTAKAVALLMDRAAGLAKQLPDNKLLSK